MNDVTRGTYAELKGDRQRLSRAFFRVNALLLRSGFFMGGLIYLVAPEFIRLFLGEKWLPMLAAFRLMLVFELLDPCKITISYVFEAVGRPERIVQARSVQLAVMVAGLFLLGPPFGITGVALAVNIMLVVGIVLLLWMARTYVDFSTRKLFLAPSIALTAALALGFGITRLHGFTDSDWLAGLLKAFVFSSVYVLVWLAMERSEAVEMMHLLRRGRLGWAGHMPQAGHFGGARTARMAPGQNPQDGAV
jgi:O-antigen/teichoic acid export membrane protein